MCIYVYIHNYTCIYTDIDMHVSMYVFIYIYMYTHIWAFAKPYMHVPKDLTGPSCFEFHLLKSLPSRDTAIAEVWNDLSWSDLTKWNSVLNTSHKLRDKGGKETSWTLFQTFLMFVSAIPHHKKVRSQESQTPNSLRSNLPSPNQKGPGGLVQNRTSP